MSNNVQVNFRVAGGELSSYMDKIKQKQQQQSDEAITNVNKQNLKHKEQQKLIQDQINLIEKKNKLEIQAERNLLVEKRKQELAARNAQYDNKADAIYNNPKLTDDQKEKRLKQLEKDRRSDERYTRDKYKDLLDENLAGNRELSIQSTLQKEKQAEEKKRAEEEIQNMRKSYSEGYDADYGVSQKDIDTYLNKEKEKSTLLADALNISKQKNAEGKEQLKIIEDQIKAIEKKNRQEADAQKNIQQSTKGKLLNENKDYFNRQRELVDKSGFDDIEKAQQHEALNLAQKDREEVINSKYSESATSLKEQERNSKKQTALAIEQIETIKQKANEQVKAVTSGDIRLADVFKNAQTDEEKLIAQLTAEGVKDQKKEGGGKGFGTVAGMVALDSVRQMIHAGEMITQTQNGFDIIGAASNTAGRVVGGLLGGLVGALAGGVGTMAGAAVGSELGGAFGGTVGAFEQRKAIARQQYWQARNKYKGLTGEDDSSVDVANMENVGVGTTQYLQMQSQYARLRGNRNDAAKTTTDAIYLDRGYGLDENTSAGVIDLQRSAKENNRDLANLIGGVLEKGKNTYFKNGDTTFLNEFMSKFISLQKELLKNQTTVATGTTMDLLTRFNKIGGEFSTSDPRSQGLMSTINNAISNPSGDFSKALTMYAIRKAHPEISDPFELMKQMQKGVAGGNLQSIFDVIQQSGGAEWSKKLGLSQITGLGNQLAFGEDLYGGLKKGIFKGKLDSSELNNPIADLQSRAEGNTAPIEVNAAHISNGLLLEETFDALKTSFINAINESLSGAVIETKGGDKIHLKSRVDVANTVKKVNETKKQVQQEAQGERQRTVEHLR
jgi:hypothetical protein